MSAAVVAVVAVKRPWCGLRTRTPVASAVPPPSPPKNTLLLWPGVRGDANHATPSPSGERGERSRALLLPLPPLPSLSTGLRGDRSHTLPAGRQSGGDSASRVPRRRLSLPASPPADART